jgi:hypothetical protein
MAFGIFCGNLVYISCVWYVVPRKIWHPWHSLSFFLYRLIMQQQFHRISSAAAETRFHFHKKLSFSAFESKSTCCTIIWVKKKFGGHWLYIFLILTHKHCIFRQWNTAALLLYSGGIRTRVFCSWDVGEVHILNHEIWATENMWGQWMATLEVKYC